MQQQPHLAQWMNELPEDVRRLITEEWTPSWMMLSSPFRGGREDRSFAAFRQPNLHAWVTLEEPS